MMEMLLAPAFIAAALLALALSGLIWWRGTRPTVTGPSCGQCGYSTIGLPSSVCPECGSDLRKVGILRPGVYRNLSAGSRIVIWSLLMPLAAYMISIALIPYAPRETTIWRSLTVSAPANTGGCDRIKIRYVRDDSVSPFQWMDIWVDHHSRAAVCMIYRDGAYFINVLGSDASPDEYLRGDRVDLSAVLALFQSAGVEVTGPQARNDAQSVLNFAMGIMANKTGEFEIEGYQSISTDFGIISRMIPMWVAWLTGLVWLFLWIVGSWFLVRTARRQDNRLIDHDRGRSPAAS